MTIFAASSRFLKSRQAASVFLLRNSTVRIITDSYVKIWFVNGNYFNYYLCTDIHSAM